MNARDRIGKGPWQNAKGVVIATSVADLHSDNNKLTKDNDLSEKGELINGYGDKPNRHDILTGSQPDGTAFPPDKDMTCQNYTSSTEGSVMFGHSDRNGAGDLSDRKIMECRASLARLLAGRLDFDRRRRSALLLRGELTG